MPATRALQEAFAAEQKEWRQREGKRCIYVYFLFIIGPTLLSTFGHPIVRIEIAYSTLSRGPTYKDRYSLYIDHALRCHIAHVGLYGSGFESYEDQAWFFLTPSDQDPY